jgi:hypothetical protein
MSAYISYHMSAYIIHNNTLHITTHQTWKDGLSSIRRIHSATCS